MPSPIQSHPRMWAADLGADMVMATPARQVRAPVTPQPSGRNPSATMPQISVIRL